MFILIYVTNPSEKVANDIADHLIKDKMVACANVFPIKSMYWWQGNIERDDEYVTILKTRPELWEKVKNEIEQIHPYDTPCIMKWEVAANAAYEDWIKKSTTGVNINPL